MADTTEEKAGTAEEKQADAHDDALVPVGPVVRYGRLAFAGVLILLGLYLVREGLDIGYDRENEPGPGFFPLWVGAVLAVLSAGWLVRELRRPADAPAQNLEARGPLRVLGLVGSMALLTLSFEPLGYNLSVLLFFLVLSMTTARGHTLAKVLVAVGASFGVYLAFDYGLGIILPGSVLPFLEAQGL
ncbi:tripartite tricarboxylate transporter TctB family protein [Streptomyces sp. SBT349]|uniref:tripartite tricarboxylate transporter TctB family protein n=1 Tax=Streptomyces sp. SBT349 TaxID=1580539 RepID=UPI00066CE105|nr:tripartite tricarboxylate transporter TctB family protein [Streptomyces sp. SBT349]